MIIKQLAVLSFSKQGIVMKICKLLLIFAFVLLPTTSQALTNKELLATMDDSYVSAYIVATVEALAFMYYVAGNKEGSQCIMDWYFKNEDTTGKIYDALKRFEDSRAQPVIYLLAKKKCGTVN